VQGHEQADTSRRNVQKDLNLVRDRVISDLHRTLRLGLIEAIRRADMAGGPRLPGSSVRYSLVEPEVRACLGALEQGPVQWREGLHAAKAQLGFVVEVEAIRKALHDDVDQHLRAPSVEVLGAVRTVLIAAHGELVKIAEEVEACRAAPVSSEDIIERMQSWTERTQGLFPTRNANQIETRMARYRATASIHKVAVSLRRAVRALAGEMRVTDPNTLVQEAARPQEVRTWRVDLRSRAADQLVHGLLPKMDQGVQDISSLLASVGPRLRDAVDIAIFALEARDGELPTEPTEGMETAFDRAISRIARLEGEVGETAQQMGPKWFAAIDHHVDLVLGELVANQVEGDADLTSPSPGKWVSQQFAEVFAPVRRWWRLEWRRAQQLWTELRAQSWSHELHVHFASGSLDAIALRQLTERWRFQEHLPEAYRSLFDGGALREKRLFSARGPELDALVSAERGWLAGGPSSALVVGEAGSGKSSLLNLAQLEFNVPRLLVPRPLSAWRETTVVGALAMELGCRAQRAAVVHVLRKVKTAVILDDLERWIEPNDAGTRSLTSLLDLIAQTSEHVFWMVSINSSALQVLCEVVPVRQTFGRVVELQPLSANDLMDVVEHRHQLSERSLRYPRTMFRPLLRGLERSSHRTLLAQVLNVASRGNLAQALTVWKRAVDVSEEGHIHPRLQRVLMVGLPSFRQLHAMELALLAHTLRFRTVTARQAASSLGHPLHRIQRHLGYLRSAGLLVAIDSRSEEFEIPRALLTPVTHGLYEVGVFG
ncbi:MAG: hypothetical protein CMH53_05955, partial [Myxococcales bacterium]|nr:hypothetical protein [Myxococcales bacterium]